MGLKHKDFAFQKTQGKQSYLSVGEERTRHENTDSIADATAPSPAQPPTPERVEDRANHHLALPTPKDRGNSTDSSSLSSTFHVDTHSHTIWGERKDARITR